MMNRWYSKVPWLLAALCLVRVLLPLFEHPAYGVFRDEFYYVACAEHPAFGYVDHPPLSIWFLWLVRHTLGESVWAMRLPSLLACVGSIIFTWLLAAEMGAGRWGRSFAATLVMLTPYFLATGGFFSMNSMEVMLWTAAAWLLTRILARDHDLTWIWLGAVLGLAAMNKLGTGIFGIAIAVGVLCTQARRWYATPWPWFGAALAAIIVLPHAIWQFAYDWPFLEFLRNAQTQKVSALGPLQYAASIALIMNPFTFPLWVGGIIALFASDRLKRFRPLGIAFVLVVIAFGALGGKAYYALPVFPIALAGAACGLETWIKSKPGMRWPTVAAALSIIVTGIALIPMSLPVLAPDAFARYAAKLGFAPPQAEKMTLGALPQHFADRFGWREKAEAVGRACAKLSEQDRQKAYIITRNYGEAGALQYYSKEFNLPPVICAHNSYWMWGYEEANGDCMIAFGFTVKDMQAAFESVEEIDRVKTDYSMPYESDLGILVCRKLKAGISEVWDSAKLFI